VVGRACVCLALALTSFTLAASGARAGTYLVNSCSAFGNGGSAFGSVASGSNWSPGNLCGSGRSFEINQLNPVVNGSDAGWITYSPSSALQIVHAYTPPNSVLVDCQLNADGFSAGYGWSGGSLSIPGLGCTPGNLGFGREINQDIGPSNYFGWVVVCTQSSCNSGAAPKILGVSGIQLTVAESASPSITRLGSNNVLNYGGRWIRGDGWPAGFSATDPSGVCGTDLLLNGQFTQLDNASSSPDSSQFVQCPTPFTPAGATLNTTHFGNGAMGLEYAANDAASNVGTDSQTVYIDNSPVSLSLATPGDQDPNTWVNHAVTVTASASAGPSGIGAIDCHTNNGSTYAYPAGGIGLNGTGVYAVTCTAANNAVDPSGNRASSGPQSVTVHIDETPPNIAFEPINPSDPTAVIVDTSDGQSGVAGGTIQMRPATGGSWQTLPTTFDGQHLLARFDDAILAHGPWVIQATSCDRAGNCANAGEPVTVPVRLGTAQHVSFHAIAKPSQIKRVVKRELVGWHFAYVYRHHHRVRVKRGGHYITVTFLEIRGRCTSKRHKIGPHRWKVIRHCRTRKLKYTHTIRAGYRHKVTVHGLLATSQAVPLPGVPVVIYTSPTNRPSAFSAVTTVRTDRAGLWSARLPAGPSRHVEAVFFGSSTLLPATGGAKVNVPARIALTASPRQLSWNAVLTLRGHLVGRYIPHDGVALRLLAQYPGSSQPKVLLALRTDSAGRFRIRWRFGSGNGTATLPFWISTTAAETDYPFAPGSSRHIAITFG
jgi:hypothetical protein